MCFYAMLLDIHSNYRRTLLEAEAFIISLPLIWNLQ